MTQYTNRYFSKRELGGKLTPDGKQYVALMSGIRSGWLRMENERLYLTPCNGKWERIDDNYLSHKYGLSYKIRTGYKKNLFLAQKNRGSWYPLYKKDGKQYHIVCSGNINNKRSEFLFPVDTLEEIPVSKNVAEAFFSVHEPSPDFKNVVARLKSKQKYAVFYLPEKDGEGVRAIGLSRMIRYPYSQSIKKIVSKQQSPDADRRDLAETIFGYTAEDSDSLRGRVQIGNAFALEPLDDEQLMPEVNGVLGQPKPSFYPFYIEQKGNKYKTYDDAEGIAGRKLYRVHSGSSVTRLDVGNGQRNVMADGFKPLPLGTTFHLKITVHNLRKVEIGALLSALTLHNAKKSWHNIGLAKGFGYGKLQIDAVELKDLAYSFEDYLGTFEDYMSKALNTDWKATPQISRLMSILSEHDDKTVTMNRLNNYKFMKSHFGRLTETPVKINSFKKHK